MKFTIMDTRIFRRGVRSGTVVRLLMLGAVIYFAGNVRAQETANASAIDAETVKALLQRVQDLESEVKTLKSQVQALNPTPANDISSTPVAASSGTVPVNSL